MKYYAGIDLGGTNIAGAIIDENNKFICHKSVKTLSERGFDAIVNDIATLVSNMIIESGIADVESIGIGSPGAVKDGSVLFSGNLKWRNAPLADMVQELTGKQTYLANDANCAALGEYIANKTDKSVALITIGTGVGFGFIKDNKIFAGDTYGGAELGHQMFKFGGERCTCGKNGCIEAYASFSALLRDANRYVEKNKKSYLASIKKQAGILDGEMIFAAAIAGDIGAKDLTNQFIEYIALAITSIIDVLDPALVIIGGGICKSEHYFMPILKEYVAKNVFCTDAGIAQIKVATLGNFAGILGAAKLHQYI